MSDTQTSEVQRLRDALVSKLGTNQNASPQQCEAVLIAMDALRGLPKDASRVDTERLAKALEERLASDSQIVAEHERIQHSNERHAGLPHGPCQCCYCTRYRAHREILAAARALTAREEGE